MKWIYLDIAEETMESAVENTWFDELKSYGYEIEKNPHITLIPGYDDTSVDLEVPSVGRPQPVEVSGYRFWPSMEKPMVVMLDVSDDMRVNIWRDDLVEQIGRKNIDGELSPPHITLFKAGDTGDEDSFNIDTATRDKIIDSVSEADLPSHVAMTEVRIEEWEL